MRSASAVLVLSFLAVSACGTANQPSGGSNVKTLEVALSNDGCKPASSSVDAGPLTVHVTNNGGDKVSELELVQNDRIVGEKENLSPGLSGSFTVTLRTGDYELYCPGASTERTKLSVTGTTVQRSADPRVQQALTSASSTYKTYVVQQVDGLVTATRAFTDAVKAGDVNRAKALYAPARIPYERIEPVAESFGDLDPAIDARIDNVDDPAQWTGFHRIEKALWADSSLAGMSPIADKLVADVGQLRQLVGAASYSPAAEDIGNGAVELLDEVSNSKITGEEERYSKTDLVDVVANVDGSRQAFISVQPALKLVNGGLASTIEARFGTLNGVLDKYRSGDSYVTYDKLTEDDTKKLSQAVNGVAEPLSQVSAILAASGGR